MRRTSRRRQRSHRADPMALMARATMGFRDSGVVLGVAGSWYLAGTARSLVSVSSRWIPRPSRWRRSFCWQ